MHSGNTDVKPNQRWTLDQTNQAVTREENKWFSDSLFSAHKAQIASTPSIRIRLRTKVCHVGSRPSIACQEKILL
jgi:hypothetical protein